jgi:hypothetical protein
VVTKPALPSPPSSFPSLSLLQVRTFMSSMRVPRFIEPLSSMKIATS